jgi:malate dehydrogenase (oxaloacetate-decarboxylating)
MFPIIYTPTEAEAISNYSHLFRRSEGLYLTPEAEDGMEGDFLDACAGRELDLVSLIGGCACLAELSRSSSLMQKLFSGSVCRHTRIR